MSTRKVYEIAVRILGLVTLLGAITYGLYGLAIFAGSSVPSVAGFARSGAMGTLGAALASMAMGIVLIQVAPGLARRLEPTEVQLDLPSGFTAQAILALAVQIIGLSMAARGLASLVAPLIELLSRPGSLSIPGQAANLTYPLARLSIGIILIFHRRLLRTLRSASDRTGRSEEGEIEDPW